MENKSIFSVNLDPNQPLGFRLAYGEFINRRSTVNSPAFGSMENLDTCGYSTPCTKLSNGQDYCNTENGLRIAQIRRKSQAYKNGLRENDYIIQILDYHGPMIYDDVMVYFRNHPAPLTLVVKRGPENERIPYPSFACIEDHQSPQICCVHGVQHRNLPPPSTPKIEEPKSSIFTNGWLSPLKKLGQWFQKPNTQEQAVELNAITFPSPADTSTNSIPNGASLVDENSWMSKALKRYANIESMSKMPDFLSKTEKMDESRPARILKVITSSTPVPTAKLEQRPSSNVLPIIRQVEPKIEAPKLEVSKFDPPRMDAQKFEPQKIDPSKVDPPKFELSQLDTLKSGPPKSDPPKFEAPIPKIPPPVPPKPQKSIPIDADQIDQQKSEWINTKIVRAQPMPDAKSPSIVQAEKSIANQPEKSIVQIRVKPILSHAFTRQEDTEEEETESTDSDEVMERKLKSSTIISVPTVVQHHGETTVRMHLKRYDRSMIPLDSDDSEHKNLPLIVIEKEQTPAENGDQETAFAENACAFPEEKPEPSFVSEDLRPIIFENPAIIMAEIDLVPPPCMEEPMLLSPEPDEPMDPLPESSKFEDFQADPSKFENSEHTVIDSDSKEEAVLQSPILTSEYPSAISHVPVLTTLDDDSDKKLSVTELRQIWPPPSNASGVEIVKDILKSDLDDEDSSMNEDSSKCLHYPHSSLFDEHVAEKVRACQSIVHELKASDSTKNNEQSKAQRMFTKRKQRSSKYVVSSSGPEVVPDSQVRMNKTPTQSAETEDQTKTAKRIRNPLGEIHDIQQMRKEYGDIVTNIASAEKCQEISQALKSQSTAGKGVDMFARRRQEAEEWVVDDHPVTSESQSSIGAMSLNFDFPTLGQEKHANAALPPHPIGNDQLRPGRRELERIPSPTPMLEWASHDRHERIFSPIPFSTRTRAPSLERIAFSPSRPFSPSPFADQTRSSSILSDRFDPREMAVKPPAHFESSMAPMPPPRSMKPQRMSSFNTLPRSWRTYSEAYQQKNASNQKLS